MPLPIAHGLLGASIVAAIHPRPSRLRFAPLLAGALLANCADLDFLLVRAFHSREWHRGFTHSLSFALCVCLLFIISLGAAHIREALAYGLAYTSHTILDYSTMKFGGGVELFWPFSTQRMGLGLVGLSELPSLLPAFEILKLAFVELLIFAPLLAVVLLFRRHLRRRRNASPAVT